MVELISNNNLMINSQVMKTTFNPSAAFNSKAKGAVYAEKGEPMYQKDMDKDEDGVITFDEFNEYCDENDISYGQRSEMLQNCLNYQLHNDRARVSAEIREIKKEDDSVYAKRGDKNYDEAMDSDKDGKVTYEEYLKYCEEQEKNAGEPSKDTSSAKMENKDDEVVITNPAKAVSTYAKTVKGEAESKIEDEA